MRLKDEPLEAGCENVELTLNKKLDVYIGQIRESSDQIGNKVLCMVTEINRVEIRQGKLSVDAKMLPLHLIEKGNI